VCASSIPYFGAEEMANENLKATKESIRNLVLSMLKDRPLTSDLLKKKEEELRERLNILLSLESDLYMLESIVKSETKIIAFIAKYRTEKDP